MRQGCSNDNDRLLLVPSASSARKRSSGILLYEVYGHVSLYAGSETLVASSTMPPVTVWNASVARPLLSFVDSAGVRGICILFHFFRKDFVLFFFNVLLMYSKYIF